MPHKHKRKAEDNNNLFELPPNQVAQPLSSSKKPTKAWKAGKPQPNLKPQPDGGARSKKRKRTTANPGYAADDTPRAFTRLLNLGKGIKPRSGLDDPSEKRKKKKAKPNEESPNESNASAFKSPESAARLGVPASGSSATELPKLLPGERMSDFSARVDAALPVSGLVSKGGAGRNIPGVKQTRTKTEKKMHRMYGEWREADQRRKEKVAEAREEAEMEGEEGGAPVVPDGVGRTKGKGGREDEEEDPWAELARRRKVEEREQLAQRGGGGLVGLHDVVLAPPRFQKVPGEKFKVKDGAKVAVLDIPGAAGSLRRREELGQARKSVVEGYRAMMKERREAVN